jgi:TetR/AcrR family transcriptional regulator
LREPLRKPASSRKEKEFAARRDGILRAAEKLFAERGFHGTTVSDLADASEFAVGTLYKFFEGKEEVYLHLMLEKLDRFHAELEKDADRYPPGLDQIRMLIEASLRFFEENRDFFKIWILEQGALEFAIRKALAQELEKKRAHTVEIFKRSIEKAMKVGEIRKMDPLDLASALQGLLKTFARGWAFNPESPAPIEKAPFIYDLFLQGTKTWGRKKVAA